MECNMSSSFPRSRATFIAALLAGTALSGLASPVRADMAPVNPPAQVSQRAMLPDFSELVTRVKPAVVSITSTMNTARTDEFHGRPPFSFGQTPREQHGAMRQARGSGFIIRADGLIVTNNHVVRDAIAVTVTMDDGRELKARVLGVDTRTDIAVLKVDAGQSFPFIELGNSTQVRPGEWVVAMGNPFGLGGTVTAGIVSAVSRDIGSGPYDQFIQVDAPINQGNSGGPLFTQDGKVIGMNTAIFSPTGGSIGIGFAIPSDMIRTVSDQLAATGRVTRGFVGVESQPLTTAMAKALHLEDGKGALLAGVSPDSPASKAGLEAGDVVRSVNGQMVTSPRELAISVAAVPPGQDARFHIVHEGQAREVTVRVGEMPNERVTPASVAPEQSSRGQLGVALAPLTAEARGQLSVPEGIDGAVIRSVRPGSPAEEAGLRTGDVIMGVGARAVHSPSDVTKAVMAAMAGNNGVVALRIMRGGESAFVGVTVPDHNSGDQAG